MKKILFIFLGVLSLNAFAFDPTQGALQNDSSLCGYGYNPNCGQSSDSYAPQKIINTTIVHVPSKYGALAFSEKPSVAADAGNLNSEAEAREAAKQRCREAGGGSCKVIHLIRNGCIAAATGKIKNKYAIYTAGGVPGSTENAALNNCQVAGAQGCKIGMFENCSVPKGMYN